MKYALCIKAEQANEPIDSWNTILLPRSGEGNCEDNPEYLQIIPYICMGREESNDVGDAISEAQYLTYERGTSGDETRLISKRSVGLGGHVDTLPPEGMTLKQHLYNELVREVQEEIGFTIDSDPTILDGALHLIPTVNSDAVGKVHIGLSLIITVPANILTDLMLESGHIENIKWETAYDLKAKALNQLVDLENSIEVYEPWSIQVINCI